MNVNRREFLLTAAVLAAPLGVEAQVVSTPTAQRLRRNVSTLAVNAPQIADYARAVQIMQGLPASDRRNWTRQADIHNQFCPHNNWWLLPWHRAYLWYFEQCCRDVLQNPDFALPYWDWTNYPKIPAPFWSGSLNHPRQVTPNDDMPSEYVGTTNIQKLMGAAGLTSIFSGATTTDDQREAAAAGDLEFGPHNAVHARILGDMGTFMSPLDPIFWLHHANVDRLWESWSRINGARFPSATLWGQHNASTFYDPIPKSNASPQVRDLLTATKWGAMYDKYETLTGATASASLASFVISPQLGQAFDGKKFKVEQMGATFPATGVRVGSAVTVAFQQPALLSAVLARVSSAQTPAAPTEAYLSIEGVARPSLQTAGLRVFLNCKNPGTQTPLDDPSYVGSIAFFDAHGATHDATTNFILDASQTVKRLSALGTYKPNGPLDVAMVGIDSLDPNKPQSDVVVHPSKVRILGVG